MKVAYLEIRTFVGTCVWYAKHYYGHILWSDGNRTDVNYKLSKADAQKLMANDRGSSFPGRYKTGDDYSGWEDRDKLISAGIKYFNKDTLEHDILLEGDCCVYDPQKMLVGPVNIFDKANALYEEFESYNGWGCKEEEEKKARRISKEWEEIVGI